MALSVLMRNIAFLAAIIVSVASPVGAAKPGTADPISATLSSVMASDARLQTIGWRLARTNAAFCPDTIPAIGLLLLDAGNYRNPPAIRVALALAGDIAVNATAEGSPAQRAGLRTGEEVLSIAGMSMAALPPVSPRDYKRLAALHDRVDATLVAEGRVVLALRHSGTVSIAGEDICRSRFVLSADGSPAGSDGQRIRIREDLLVETVDDEEAAAPIAHELAHNILRHPQRLDAGGRKSAAVRATEVEADRLAPWLMANAGYDPQAAIRFGERRRRARLVILQPRTHERWDKRLVAIREEVALIDDMRASGIEGPIDWRSRFSQALAAPRAATPVERR